MTPLSDARTGRGQLPNAYTASAHLKPSGDWLVWTPVTTAIDGGQPLVRPTPSPMRPLNFLLDILAWILRLALKLVGLALGLVLVLIILGFILIGVLWRLISGRRPNINVSAHFSHVRTVTDLGQNLMRQRRDGPSGDVSTAGRPLAAPREDVQDVQARDLPPDRR